MIAISGACPGRDRTFLPVAISWIAIVPSSRPQQKPRSFGAHAIAVICAWLCDVAEDFLASTVQRLPLEELLSSSASGFSAGTRTSGSHTLQTDPRRS